ncbi:MAG: hypothetical protein RL675_295 [Bacteroidota bacterium]|jgi:hypothetical protein
MKCNEHKKTGDQLLNSGRFQLLLLKRETDCFPSAFELRCHFLGPFGATIHINNNPKESSVLMMTLIPKGCSKYATVIKTIEVIAKIKLI